MISYSLNYGRVRGVKNGYSAWECNNSPLLRIMSANVKAENIIQIQLRPPRHHQNWVHSILFDPVPNRFLLEESNWDLWRGFGQFLT